MVYNLFNWQADEVWRFVVLGSFCLVMWLVLTIVYYVRRLQGKFWWKPEFFDGFVTGYGRRAAEPKRFTIALHRRFTFVLCFVWMAGAFLIFAEAADDLEQTDRMMADPAVQELSPIRAVDSNTVRLSIEDCVADFDYQDGQVDQTGMLQVKVIIDRNTGELVCTDEEHDAPQQNE